jgi:hypothetical protein
MSNFKDDSEAANRAVVEMYAELPAETAGWLSDAASRFNVDRSVIVQRAVEHYLAHVEEVKDAFDQRSEPRSAERDWQRAMETLERANCPYEECPFQGDCPADVCAL